MTARHLMIALLVLALSITGPSAWAAGNGNGPCGGQSITKASHFTYDSLSLSTYTFNGAGGSPVTFSFIVTAPSGGQVFPDCNTPDTADFIVQDITQVADANNNPVDIDLSTNSGIGAQIAAAFSFSPPSHSFDIGDSVTVSVTLTNPALDSSAYGAYQIKLAAKETVPTSTGIGVGSGAQFTLVLAPPVCTDTAAPIVTPVNPNGVEQKLGEIGVTFTAIDPDTPPGCEDGIVSMDYSVKSAGGTDHSDELGSLTEDPPLPQPAGVLVTATGSFMPKGWSGAEGTVNGTPFTGSSLSGIGTYTITETASDGTFTTSNTDTFSVDYVVTFTASAVSGLPSGHCSTATGSSANGCQVHFEFNVNRSGATSDGAFMVDQTVAVALRTGTSGSSPTSGSYVAVHYYGCDSPFSNVKIETTTGVACTPASTSNAYKTNFKRMDIGATAPGTYVADVWFKDVDGNWVLEASSPSVTF